jgi:hypothetical protein
MMIIIIIIIIIISNYLKDAFNNSDLVEHIHCNT